MASPTELITAVRQQRLFDQLNLQIRESPRWFSQHGESFVLHAPARSLNRIDFSVAVHPATNDAVRIVENTPHNMSVGPDRHETADDIGDRRLVWGVPEQDSGFIVFARRNVTVHLSWSGPFNNGVALARAIDNLLQNDGEAAPLGSFAEAPAIETTSLPATLTVPPHGERLSRMQAYQPTIRGLGDPQRVRFGVFLESGSGGPINHVKLDGRPEENVLVANVDARKGRPGSPTSAPTPGDGRYMIDLRHLSSKLGSQKLVLVAVNDDNVVASRTVEVNVVRE